MKDVEKKIREEKKAYLSECGLAQETISRQNPAAETVKKENARSKKSMERRFEKEKKNMTEMPEQEGAIFFLSLK